jgi:transposase-like protein
MPTLHNDNIGLLPLFSSIKTEFERIIIINTQPILLMWNMERTYNFPKCGIHHSVSVRHGYRYNKSGWERLNKCKGCGTKFTLDRGLLRRSFQKKHIAEAICLHERFVGMVLTQIAVIIGRVR